MKTCGKCGPEMRASRHADALAGLKNQIDDREGDARHEGGDGHYSGAELGPGDEPGHESEDGLDLSPLGIEFGFDTRQPPV